MISRAFLPALVLLGTLIAGCSNSPTAPTTTTTSTTPTVTPLTEVFVGSLPKGGSSFYSFTVVQKSNVFLMLASLTLANTGPTLSVPVNLGLGVPAGIGCGLPQACTVGPAL